MPAIIKGALDKGLEKVVSRKLLVWATATALATSGFLTSSDWVTISALYLGGQAIIDAVVQLKGVIALLGGFYYSTQYRLTFLEGKIEHVTEQLDMQSGELKQIQKQLKAKPKKEKVSQEQGQ